MVLAFDFGVQNKFLGNLWFGVALKNIGNDMRYTGTDLQQKTQVPCDSHKLWIRYIWAGDRIVWTAQHFRVKLSSLFKISQDNSLMLAALYRNNNVLEDDVCVGGDLTDIKMIHIRGGMHTSRKIRVLLNLIVSWRWIGIHYLQDHRECRLRISFT